MLLGILNKGFKLFVHLFDININIKMVKGSAQEHSSPKIMEPIEHTSLHPTHIQMLAKRFEGKLLLQEEIPLPKVHFQQLLDNHYFIPIPCIQQNRFSHHCTRCHNKQTVFFGEIPCSRCNITHLYCRKCIHMGRMLACESLYFWNGPDYLWPTYKEPCTWNGRLTPAQEDAAKKIISVIMDKRSLIVWAVTGSGKTEMLFPSITYALEQGLRICIASPRADVVRELLPRFKEAFQSIHIQGLYSGSRDNDGTAQLIISTTHQLLRYKDAFDLLIIDEIDAFPYHQDRTLQFAANRAKKQNAAIIHLTATPRDKQLEQIASKKMNYTFVPVRFHGHPLVEPSFIQDHQLVGKLNSSLLPTSFVKWLASRSVKSRQLLIFVPTITLAKRLEKVVSKILCQQKIITSPNQVTNVHAEDTDRQRKIELFRSKGLYALITTTILERGVTFPSVDVAVLHAGHSIFDEAALIQITGRAGRSPIDPTGEVCFFHDGKTEAMVRAKREIIKMNKRREKLIDKGGNNSL